jgi:hypothetical protein
MKTVWFNELTLYAVRSFNYLNKQVRADEVSREIVQSTLPTEQFQNQESNC